MKDSIDFICKSNQEDQSSLLSLQFNMRLLKD